MNTFSFSIPIAGTSLFFFFDLLRCQSDESTTFISLADIDFLLESSISHILVWRLIQIPSLTGGVAHIHGDFTLPNHFWVSVTSSSAKWCLKLWKKIKVRFPDDRLPINPSANQNARLGHVLWVRH